MRYTGNTISKPVVGKEAIILSDAIKSGGYVCNDKARETISRIVESIKKRKK